LRQCDGTEADCTAGKRLPPREQPSSEQAFGDPNGAVFSRFLTGRENFEDASLNAPLDIDILIGGGGFEPGIVTSRIAQMVAHGFRDADLREFGDFSGCLYWIGASAPSLTSRLWPFPQQFQCGQAKSGVVGKRGKKACSLGSASSVISAKKYANVFLEDILGSFRC